MISSDQNTSHSLAIFKILWYCLLILENGPHRTKLMTRMTVRECLICLAEHCIGREWQIQSFVYKCSA